MKRQPRNKQNSAVSNSRSLRVESLEDRNLMTVAAEMVQMPQESQIGSEHWPEPAAEIAVEKATNERQGFFSRGLHNNGAFHDPAGHILWNASDDSETSSDSYTDSGRITYYAYELKNVLLTSVRDGQGNDKSSFLGIPSCPEVASNWQDRNNVVLEDVVSFESGSSHCVEIAMFSSRASNDPVFFSHHANVDKVFGENGLGGQEGEPVTENQFSLNFEEIRVTYRDSGGMSEAADFNGEDATESSADSTDGTLASTPSDDHDRIGGEGKDDEVPGLPGEDETLTPDARDFLLDPAKTEGSDGDDIWDVQQGK